jgi:adenosylhomocysteinase
MDFWRNEGIGTYPRRGIHLPASRGGKVRFDIRDINLADKGKLRIEWAKQSMPVLSLVKKRFAEQQPLRGINVSACLHVTTETANLMDTLKAGGAEVALCASNPLSTQDDAAASLVKHIGVPVFAIKGEDKETYYRHIESAIEFGPHITMDDGADTISVLHSQRRDLIPRVIAGTEETTTGVIRLKSMEKEGVLAYPVIAVNDAQTKHFFDNRYGTGQSTIDGILRATNLLLAGTRFVVCGYGWCGRGVAMRARGMGSNVIVVETDALRALEAVMDGYTVMRIAEAAKVGEIFVTVTGDIHVLRREHFLEMKDGAVICNSGHFNVEIDIAALEAMAVSRRPMREFVEEYTLPNGRRINLLGEGRLINLAAAEGHPASVMDMSFANQALSVEFAVKNRGRLEKKVYAVPEEIDSTIAGLKLKAIGITIDELTEEQKKYLASWDMGT